MLVLLGMTAACEKDFEVQTSELSVRFLALPGEKSRLDKVNLEIKQLQILHKSGSKEVWVDLATSGGIYDLVKMQDGKIYTPVNRSKVRPGVFTKLKIIPGGRNTVEVKGKSFPLMVESTFQQGIIIEHDVRIGKNSWIDYRLGFDVAASVVHEPNGIYRLKPITRVVQVTHRPGKEAPEEFAAE